MPRAKVEALNARLSAAHATAAAFLDETGIIAQDRFFAVGCLVLPDPADVLRKVQKLRDRRHWYGEIKWVDLTETSRPLYQELVDIVAGSDGRFSCFVADRSVHDPVERFQKDAWLAYEKLATQLLIGASKPNELLSVLADNYSAPDHVHFEQQLRCEVNRRLGCLSAVTVCRLDSRACDALQLVDVLTGAVTFEHRAAAGLAGNRSAKARLSEYVRAAYGVDSTLGGLKRGKINVAMYGEQPKREKRVVKQVGVRPTRLGGQV